MSLKKYANKHGNSGVYAYDSSKPGELTVVFFNRSTWVYSSTENSRGIYVGKRRLQTMKSYARNGLRLQRYINRYLRR